MGFLAFLEKILTKLYRPKSLSTENLNTHKHLIAAIEWIRIAHRVNGDGGISKGYNILYRYWYPSYPETTGYTIPTLLNVSMTLNCSELKNMALDLADYLLKNITPEGGVAHWADSGSNPVVFDTGQAIFGWLAAFNTSGDKRYLEACKRAGNWLVSIQDSSGSWKNNQHLGVEKVIDTRVAWALLKLYQYTKRDAYRISAIRNCKWTLKQQYDNGWFRKCSFVEGEDPFTHTLAYTAEGLFECGWMLNEESYVNASRLTADALLARQHADGKLASTYDFSWRETSVSSCLTGNCQMSRLWLRFYKTNGNAVYYEAAKKAISFVANTQKLKANSKIRGGIAGSYPIFGRYERFKYPNWAAKFFIDALLTIESLENKKSLLFHIG